MALIGGYSLLEAFLLAVGLTVGLGGVPFLAITRLSIPFISGPIARLTWEIAGFGMGRPILWLTDDLRYTIVGGTGDEEPQSMWSRCGLNPFAIAYDEDPDTFEGAVRHREELADYADGEVAEGRVTTPIKRGGARTFWDADRLGEWWVPWGQWLAAFRDAASGDVVRIARSEEFEDSGGDTGGLSQKFHVATILTMTVLGAVFGYGVFVL